MAGQHQAAVGQVIVILRGDKKAEYRSRPTRIRERVYLYASAQPAKWPPAWAKLSKRPGDLRTRAILGCVEAVGCRWDHREECHAYGLILIHTTVSRRLADQRESSRPSDRAGAPPGRLAP